MSYAPIHNVFELKRFFLIDQDLAHRTKQPCGPRGSWILEKRDHPSKESRSEAPPKLGTLPISGK